MTLPFYKYQGTGNDFVIMDNRDGKIRLSTEQVSHICDRRFGIGADGLMLLGTAEGYDFSMVYYNADGREGSMCGNGGRCLTRFAYDMGIHKSSFLFTAVDGDHTASLSDNGWIHLKMKDVDTVTDHHGDFILDTGSPHYVKQSNDIKNLDVYEEGKEIRYSKDFAEKGINVNFVEKINDDEIFVRTYERGVEDETYSCGTGVTASALTFLQNNNLISVKVKTLGGNLKVYAEQNGNSFKNIWLEGPAKQVFKGKIDLI